MQKTKSQSGWKRKLTKQEKTVCIQTKEKIFEKQKTKSGLTSDEITSLLSPVRHFAGCFAVDQVSNLSFSSFPCFIIVNIDHSFLPGSHWLAVRIDRSSVEVFDPAGFKIFNWPRVPCNLLSFLHRLTVNRTIQLTDCIQPTTSFLCGFYCIFYILHRQHSSLSTITSLFNSNLRKNDRELIKLFR